VKLWGCASRIIIQFTANPSKEPIRKMFELGFEKLVVSQGLSQRIKLAFILREHMNFAKFTNVVCTLIVDIFLFSFIDFFSLKV